MIYIAKNKICAIIIYLLVNTVVYFRGDNAQLESSLWVLSLILIPILLPRLEAWFASRGYMESLAKDFRLGVSPDLVSFCYWFFLIIASLFFLFNWSLY